MEIKKTPKADLENKKSTWMLIGYVIVLAFMFIAFEWTKRDIKIDTSQALTDLYFEEEMVPITEQEEKVAPSPPEVATINETLEIVADDADVEETVIASSEETGKAVEVKYVPVQVVEEEPEEQTIFEVVENMPDFPGGQAALMQYLAKNIKYPTIAQENGTQGRVIVQFVVSSISALSSTISSNSATFGASGGGGAACSGVSVIGIISSSNTTSATAWLVSIFTSRWVHSNATNMKARTTT